MTSFTSPGYTAPSESQDAAEARLDFFDATFPYWEQAVNPERFVSESDMLVPGTDATRAVWAVSDADFDAMCEALWVDPAERAN
jgi:hypothetical protein